MWLLAIQSGFDEKRLLGDPVPPPPRHRSLAILVLGLQRNRIKYRNDKLQCRSLKTCADFSPPGMPQKRERESLINLPDLRVSLSSRAGHGGVTLGAVLLSPQHADPLRRLLERVLGEGVRFRGVDRVADMLLVHLRPSASWAFEREEPPPHPELVTFMATSGAMYYPGVRMRDAALGRPLAHPPPPPPPPPSSSAFTFAEIFAGIGGFRLGLAPLGGRCVLASEIDTAAMQTYAAHFGASDDLLIGDICEHYAEDLPSFDILTAGFPCQPFSTRGDQKGFSEPRGQLYLELVRLLRHCRPKAFLFENVANLVYMDGGSNGGGRLGEPLKIVTGRPFDSILAAFQGCGYDVTWRIVNARHWLPQYRERVYLVGFRSDLAAHMDWEWEGVAPAAGECSTVRGVLEPKECVAASVLTEAQTAKLGKTIDERHIPLDDKAPTLISSYHNATNVSSKFIFEEADGTIRDRPRFLTPRECARLMGFPEDFHVPADTNEIGRAWFYSQIGNAVCPPVINAIGLKMLHALSNAVAK